MLFGRLWGTTNLGGRFGRDGLKIWAGQLGGEHKYLGRQFGGPLGRPVGRELGLLAPRRLLKIWTPGVVPGFQEPGEFKTIALPFQLRDTHEAARPVMQNHVEDYAF